MIYKILRKKKINNYRNSQIFWINVVFKKIKNLRLLMILNFLIIQILKNFHKKVDLDNKMKINKKLLNNYKKNIKNLLQKFKAKIRYKINYKMKFK